MTRSARGTAFLISSTAALTASFSRVGKFDSVIVNSEKFTSRSASATRVSLSILIVPSAGFGAPAGS